MGWRAAFIASITALLCAAPAAQADVFTVIGTGDGGQCSGLSCPSLRAAIAASEATKEEADTINVPAGVININNDLVVQSEMTIVGVSARSTIIDGGAKYRGFRVTTSGQLAVRNFTVRNGAAGGGDINDGGGLLNQGVLSLQDVRVTGSRATRGGGIANYLGRLVADNLLVDNNTAAGVGGGGIHNIGGSEIPAFQGYLALTDTTVFKNTGTGRGGTGGIDSSGNGALITLSRSTIADNVGATVGGFSPSGSSAAVGTVIARNLVGGDLVNCGDTKPTDSSFNVEDDKDCNLAPGGMKPQLATALSNEGGQLDVLTIPAASDAFNRLPSTNQACTGTDQRGTQRPQGSACDAGAFEVEQAATVTITEGPSGTITTTGTEFRFQDSGGDVTVQCDLTGPGQTPGFETCYKSNAQPYSDLADGPYTFSVRAVSAAFPNPPVSTRSFVVNAAGPPNTTITAGPTGPTNHTTPTFSFTSSEPGSTFQCALDSTAANAWAACASPHTTAALTPGGHTIFIRAIDAAGAVDATPASRAFTVDTAAPDTTIATGPSGNVSSTSATFTFTSTETGSTFQCALDGAAFSTCPASYTGLAQGAHTFQVRAIDAAGNQDATPASRTWTVDTSVPDTTIGSGPSGPTTSTTATFTFTSNEAGVTFECALDGAAFGACPVQYTGLAQGSHTFQVRARDAAGNVDASPASRTWTVDTSVPDTTINTGPSGTVNSTTATFTFSSNEPGVTFQCSFDGGAFGNCPVSYTGLAQGAHTFQVRAVDAAGNQDASPASRTWTVDTVAPAVTIDASPARTNDTTPSFTFSSNEAGGTFQCRTDSGAFAGCTSPYTTATLGEGSHTVEVRATDVAGNQGSATSRTVVIDVTAPTVTINSGPTGLTNDNTPTFGFSSEAGATFECRVDSAAFAACASPHTTAALADGGRTFQVRAIDTAGNTSSAASRAITVDTAAPAPPAITSPAENALLAVGTVNMVGTAEPNATVQLTEGAASAGSSPSSGTGTWNVVLTPTDGSHTYTARTTDAAGNVSAATTRTIRIDTVMPTTTIVSGPSGTTSDTTPTWTFASNEAGSTFECALDGAAHTACSTPFTAPTLAPGSHTLSVRAVDPAGNRDNTPETRTIVVDTTAPTVTITSGPTSQTSDTTPTFVFTAEAGATFQCRIDGAAFATCTSPHTPTVTAEASHTFEVRATDTAGNTATDTWSFTTDTTRPNTTITGGPPSPGNDTTPEFTFTSNETGATFECRVGAAAFAACTSPHTTAALAAGGHTLEVRATDRAGNVDDTPASRSFIIDTTPPGAPSLTAAPSPVGNDNTPTFQFSGDANATFQCRLDTPTFTACTSPVSPPALSDGAHTFAVRAVDAAGNESAPTIWNFAVDTAAPNAPVVQQPAQSQWLTASSVTVSGTAEAGAFVEVKEGGVTRGSATATGGAWTVTVAVVPDGAHTYAVTARDGAGNTSAAANRSFRVDTVAPGAPAITVATANGSTVTLSGTSEAGATVELRDGATPVGTTTAGDNANWALTLTNVADGSYSYTARARDAAGNQSAPSAARSVVVDTGPPAAPALSGPSAATNDNTPTFTFTGEGTFRCSLDGAEPSPCTSPLDVSAALPDGPHTFSVFAIDSAGNRGEPSALAFTVDTAPPATGVTGGPDGATTDPNPAFTFSASDPKVECRLAGPAGPGVYEGCASPKAFSALPPGAYTFFVRVTDAAGNQTETQRAFTVTQPQGAQPTPVPTVVAAQTPTPTPVPNQTIVVAPATGTVLVKQRGQRTFEPLDVTKGIPNGSEVDVRKGRVTLTAIPKAGAPAETADFYGGIFIVTQKGGITDLKLSERLTGCPRGQQASLSQKKVKKRKLWGNGKGSFRTTGKHSAATVRGTTWLVEDSCTTTLTRVTAGVVQVNDFVTKKKKLVKKNGRYVARAKKR